jgi:hypothetical protein
MASIFALRAGILSQTTPLSSIPIATHKNASYFHWHGESPIVCRFEPSDDLTVWNLTINYLP